MSLFGGIDPQDDWATIDAAGRRIAEGLLDLPAPRSLAELRLDAQDCEWLLEWARSASHWTVGRWLTDRTTKLALTKLTRQDAVGLLLFAVAAEVARRDAAEGHLWSAVSKRFGSASRSLFIQGQPTYQLKSAFERVAAGFQLRNVFGIAGTQNWYVSTYLQFGFTYRGIEQLPMWLAGHPLTESVQDLLHDNARQSPTFRKLFEDLRLYRKDNITVEALRRTIVASPWVLPEWSERLVEAARQKMHLGAGSGGVIDSEDAIPFVGIPRLTWTPGQRPMMHLPLQHLAQVLSDGTYHVEVGRERIGVLISDTEMGVTGDMSIEVPLRAPAVTVTIRHAEDGSPVCAQEVAFWDVAEDVSAYDLESGRQIDAWNEPVSNTHAYGLILADDLELMPRGADYGLAAGHRIHYAQAGIEGVEVRLEGAVLWEPTAPGSSRPPQPDWLRRVEVVTVPRGGSVTVGQELRLQFINVDGKVQFLRFGSAPMDFEQEPGGSYGVSEPFKVMPYHLGATTIVSLGVEHDGLFRVRRFPVSFDGSGALLLTDDGWESMDKDAEVTVAAVESSRVRLIWRDDDRHRVSGLGVMAGSTFIRRAWDGTSSIRGLPGYGGRLEIREPYNPIHSSGFALAASIVDPGIIAALNIDEQRAEITLSSPIEPDDEYRCVVVDTGGEISSDVCSAGPDGWQWSAPLGVPSPGDVAAVAISYRGRRIGAAFEEGFDALLMEAIHGDANLAERGAALARWLRVPILAPQYRSKFERLTGDRPCEVLASWLTNHELPDGLVRDVSEEWLSTVRSFYLQPQGNMKPEAFALMWTALAQHDDREEALTPLDYLDEVSPLLFYRGVQWALWKKLAPDRPSIASFLWGATVADVMASSLQDAAGVMQVEENFLRTGVAAPTCDALFDSSKSLQPYQWQNLETCLAVPAFRRYICARVLKEAPP